MSGGEKSWTGSIHLGAKVDIDVVFEQLVKALMSPFLNKHHDYKSR